METNIQKQDFSQLLAQVKTIDNVFSQVVQKAINRAITARNWLIGYRIVHYEQQGSHRAEYGEKIVDRLAEELNSPSLTAVNLRLYRKFYQEYPDLVAPILEYVGNQDGQFRLAIGKMEMPILQSPIIKSDHTPYIDAETLFSSLSFTHFVQLLPVKDPLARTFYEVETIKGTWSTRELKRQIRTNYFERTALSHAPEKMSTAVQTQSQKDSLQQLVKSPHVYEFLGLRAKDVIEESDLEQALMDHLQEFMLELGTGFCFEARQKRILIDDEYYFCDLVFYHRILKCHVIVELKAREFAYPDVTQLNMYVAYFRDKIMQSDDNPPIGILLCTEVGKEQVKYATAGMDEHLFISKYQLQLPSVERLTEWLRQETKEISK